MLKSLAALGAACTLACAPALGLAQAYPQVLGPGGSYINPDAALIFVQACNGGLGGFVGQTYGGSECFMPEPTSSGSNAAASGTGSTVPAAAGYTGFNAGGTLVGVSAANPLPVTGSISATNPSVSATGSAAPASAGYVGFSNGGTLTGVSTATPLPAATKPSALTRTSLSTTLASNVGSITIAANAGRLEIVNPDPTNVLWASWDVSPTAGAASTGAFPIQANGGFFSDDGVNGTLHFYSTNATAKVTANLWN